LKFSFPSLYLISDPSFYETSKDDGAHQDFFCSIQEAIAGGIRLIQYRDKSHSRGEKYEIAKTLRGITRDQGVTLIINDEIDLAMAVKADGVHLGQDDFPVSMARRLLGEEAIIGLSTHNLEQAIAGSSEAIDYIGFGPIFETTTKVSESPLLGLDAIVAVRSKISLPIYVIGGIQRSHLLKKQLIRTCGVAVSSALAGADRKTFQNWIELLEGS